MGKQSKIRIIEPHRICAFCDRVADTKEHIPPVWLSKLQGPSTGSYHTVTLDGGEGLTGYLHRPTANSITMKCLCQVCNNEWSSDLQNKTKPIIESIIGKTNKLITLDSNDARTLAQWSIFEKMIIEVSDLNTRTCPDEERRKFSQELVIPDNFSVYWANANALDRQGFNHFAWQLDKRILSTCDGLPTSPPFNNSITVLTAGYLVIFVLRASTKDKNIRTMNRVKTLGLNVLWPLLPERRISILSNIGGWEDVDRIFNSFPPCSYK